jgi:hypothetical protein
MYPARMEELKLGEHVHRIILVEHKRSPSVLDAIVEETKMKGFTPECEQTK